MGWPLTARDLKRYPHFDRPLPLDELIRIANSPAEVARNCFWPFLYYEKSWIRFRKSDKSRADLRKSRPIRYASRKDSAIYSRYRALLSDNYEVLLAANGLSDCVLAYRKILKPGRGGGKTNVDFAFEAFQKIKSLGACCAVALDIKGYFDNMDHTLLKAQWCRVMSVDRLPQDHYQVFQSVTRYASVDRDALYAHLEYMAIEPGPNGGQYKRWLIPRQDVPTQICAPHKFRRIAENNDLVKVNNASYGIPQGAPISDVLANIYLLDFDAEMLAFAKRIGGHYMRYSDDILVIVPGGETEGRRVAAFAGSMIRKYGDQIQIKEEKTEIIEYSISPIDELVARNVTKPGGKDGLEYLGFRFDGRNAYLRDATLARVLRKMTVSVRREAKRIVARYPGEDHSFLQRQLQRREIHQRFRQVRDFDEKVSKRSWTFHTYVRRAAKVFGPQGQNFHRQTRNQISFFRKAIEREISRAVQRDGRPEL